MTPAAVRSAVTGLIMLGVLAGLGALYFKGRADGRGVIVEALQDDRITVLLDGKAIDENVLGADDAGLCGMLGGCGLPDAAEPD